MQSNQKWFVQNDKNASLSKSLSDLGWKKSNFIIKAKPVAKATTGLLFEEESRATRKYIMEWVNNGMNKVHMKLWYCYLKV